MLKINNLVELMDIVNIKLKHKIPNGTVFEYKNNCYIVERASDVSTMCSKGCNIRNDFNNDIGESELGINSCHEECPFGCYSIAVKLSEIETLILNDKE